MINYIPNDFLNPKNKLAILVGAGISADFPSNLPLAGKLIKSIISAISTSEETREELFNLSRPDRDDRLGIYDYIRFEKLLSILQKSTDNNLEILKCYGQCESPNTNHYFIANLIIQGNIVITTNFDHLIELALCDLGHIPSTVYSDEAFANSRSSSNTLTNHNPIFKIHRTIKKFYKENNEANSDFAINSVIATLEKLSSVGLGFKNSSGKYQFMKNIIESYDMIILGYSGGDDYDISELLVNIQTDRRLLWMYPSGELHLLL
jgi:NAD-dependent SIR2 family protein deacetylase